MIYWPTQPSETQDSSGLCNCFLCLTMYRCQTVNQITLWAIIWHLYIVQYLVGPYCNECHDDISLGVKLRRHIRSGPPKAAPATCSLSFLFVCKLFSVVVMFLYPYSSKRKPLKVRLTPLIYYMLNPNSNTWNCTPSPIWSDSTSGIVAPSLPCFYNHIP